jgi:hypothetical protein
MRPQREHFEVTAYKLLQIMIFQGNSVAICIRWWERESRNFVSILQKDGGGPRYVVQMQWGGKQSYGE